MLVLKVMRRIGRSILPTKVKVWTLVHLRVYAIRKKNDHCMVQAYNMIKKQAKVPLELVTLLSLSITRNVTEERIQFTNVRYEWKGYFYKIDRKEVYTVYHIRVIQFLFVSCINRTSLINVIVSLNFIEFTLK